MNSDAIVYIVDDDAGVRMSLELVMESASLAVRGYASGEEFLASFDRERPGCLVLDLRMPGLSGIDVLQRLRGDHNEMPAIIISGHADVKATVRSMKLGAIDVLQKPFEPGELLEAVRDGIQKSISAQKRLSEQKGIQRRMQNLTPREFDLLKLVVAGLPNKRIAERLNISIKTVANHRASLMAKTQALNAADLARLTTIAGIQPDDSRDDTTTGARND